MDPTRTSRKTTSTMWRLLTAALVAGSVLAAPVHGRAQTPAVQDATQPQRSFALTLAPVLLYVKDEEQSVSMVELTGEVRFTSKLSAALVLGLGRVKQTATIAIPGIVGRTHHGGLQGRYYILGDFRHGMQLGFEFLYAHHAYVDAGFSVRMPSAGAFAGYKFTARSGFTFDAQFGARAIDETLAADERRTTVPVRVAPLLNANVGWSF